VSRVLWVDLIKVIAIFSVVFLHSASPILYQYSKIDILNWHIGNMYDSALRMCVPLFFMISGVLLLNAKEESLSMFFRKRLKKVILPLFIWSLIYIIFRKFALHEDINIFKAFLNSLVLPQYYHLWFLYAIIGIYFFIPILKIFINNSSNNIQIYFLVLWIITVFMMPLASRFLGNEIPNYMPMMTGYIGYFVLGYLLCKIKITKRLFSLSIILFFVSTTITFLDTFYLTQKAGVFTSYFYEYLTLSTLIQATSFFIILKFIGEKYLNTQSRINSIIVNISFASFGIYLIHPIVLWILGMGNIDALNGHNTLYMVPVTALMAFFISFGIIYLMQKISFFKHIIP
jgi:surface polysaccharide O-acyltransferase-like enzyme